MYSFIYLFILLWESITSFGLLHSCMMAFALLGDLAWIVCGQRVQSPPALEMRSFIFYLNNGLRTQRLLAQQGAESTNQLASTAIFNCLTFPSPHQSFSILCLEAKKQRLGKGEREGGRETGWGWKEERRRGETVWCTDEAKPADRAIPRQRSPDTALDRLKGPSLELMWEHNGPGWKTQHVFVELVIGQYIAVRKA